MAVAATGALFSGLGGALKSIMGILPQMLQMFTQMQGMGSKGIDSSASASELSKTESFDAAEQSKEDFKNNLANKFSLAEIDNIADKQRAQTLISQISSATESMGVHSKLAALASLDDSSLAKVNLANGKALSREYLTKLNEKDPSNVEFKQELNELVIQAQGKGLFPSGIVSVSDKNPKVNIEKLLAYMDENKSIINEKARGNTGIFISLSKDISSLKNAYNNLALLDPNKETSTPPNPIEGLKKGAGSVLDLIASGTSRPETSNCFLGEC